MAKTEIRLTLYAEKIENLIKKGLITEADIVDTTVKAEYTKRKKA